VNQATAWVVAAVATSAAAGVATGLALCQARADAAAAVELQAADREVLERLRTDLDLSGDQAALLRAILRTLRDDETQIYRRNHSNLPTAVQDELLTARRAADVRIQFMLDRTQRARYDQLRAIDETK
jgi:hypothetical protein